MDSSSKSKGDDSLSQEESFEDVVAHMMVMAEELKRSIASAEMDFMVPQWTGQMEGMVGRLDFLMRKAMDDPVNDVKRDLAGHCRAKAIETFQALLNHTVTKKVRSSDGSHLFFDEEMQGQAAVARMAELSIVVHDMVLPKHNLLQQQPNDRCTNNETTNTKEIEVIIDAYSNYQRQILRQRAKPSIAFLASWRQENRNSSKLQQRLVEEQDDDDDDDGKHTQPHSHALTTILGQASALIHPLLMWSDSLPPSSSLWQLCYKSIQVVDEQAQDLVKKISDWFWVDRKVDDWVQQQAESNPNQDIDLPTLDRLVDEMSFSCQVMARYDSLMDPYKANFSRKESEIIEKELLPEWTWKYAMLERFLAVKHLHSAWSVATPVNIVMGQPVKVPSIVEDAQYLSTRAISRATSTRSTQAMGTVAHSLSHDIWSTDSAEGVHQALLDEKGCWANDEEESKQTCKSYSSSHSPKSGDFASALLDALDEDLKKAKTPPPSAPSSGGILGSLNLSIGKDELQKVRQEMQLCLMNGIHSASTACSSLVQSLDGYLEEQQQGMQTNHSNSMVSLAREELNRFSDSYNALLQVKVKELVSESCGNLDFPQSSRKGKCLHKLHDFFCAEKYDLDSGTFSHAEGDERLNAELLQPLQRCKLLTQLERCESEVRIVICTEFSTRLSDMIVNTLWMQKKQFTDWGSLLLSKQIRILQTYASGLMSVETIHSDKISKPTMSLKNWERLSQVVTVLQLEKPSDWSIYQDTSVLRIDELRRTMNLRMEFSTDAVNMVCQTIESNSEEKPENKNNTKLENGCD